MKTIATFALAVLIGAAPATATMQRTFVSAATGSDTNPCSRVAPCRNFTAAMAQTDPGGEVVVLDSGGYGAVIITKSVLVEAPTGVVAAISVFTGASGVQIDAAPTDTVILRGLTINGLGGSGGIVQISALMLSVENMAIQSIANGIVNVDGGTLVVKDSSFLNMQNQGIDVVSNTGAAIPVVVERCVIVGNGEFAASGVVAEMGARMAIRDTVITGFEPLGIGVGASTDTTAIDVMIENCLITRTLAGIVTAGLGSTVVRVSNSTISHNSAAIIAQDASQVLSRVNNTLESNGVPGGFTGTYTAH